MATPHRRMVTPAATWAYRSAQRKDSMRIPSIPANTAPSMVATVTTPNVNVTSRRVLQLSVAAGNMSNGIRTSQGPSRKMTKSTHGVMLALELSEWG